MDKEKFKVKAVVLHPKNEMVVDPSDPSTGFVDLNIKSVHIYNDSDLYVYFGFEDGHFVVVVGK